MRHNGWATLVRGVLAIAWCVSALAAGQGAGSLEGELRLTSGAPVPGAEVRIEDQDTGWQRSIITDEHGHFRFDALMPSRYAVRARSALLRTVRQSDIAVVAGQRTSADLVTEVLPLQQEMTVTASPSGVADPNAAALTVSRRSQQNAFPTNGRDPHAYFALLPGAVVTPAEANSGGQFTVGGMRPNANAFRVDGLSGNSGAGLVAQPGSAAGASLPGMTTIGGTQSLAGKEETERVEMRASDFSAEGGERPGATISVETKSGSNQFHGTAFTYARPRMLNSLDPFEEEARVGAGPADVLGGGAAGGGPVRRNHTFFFASFEYLTLFDMAVRLMALPTQDARSRTSPGVQAYLRAFPIPYGRHLNGNEAVGGSAFFREANVSNFSGRLDQNLGSSTRLFVRYAGSPSSANTWDLGTARSTLSWNDATLGFTKSSSQSTRDLKLHFSQARMQSEHFEGYKSDKTDITAVSDSLFQMIRLSTVPGSPLDPDPNRRGSAIAGSSQDRFYNFPFGWSVTSLAFSGAGQAISSQAGINVQRQYEVNSGLALQRGRHEYRFGADFVGLQPNLYGSTSTLSIASPGIAALINGALFSVTNFVRDPQSQRDISVRAFLFAQDTFRINPRLTVQAGARWELTPPLSPFNLNNLSGYQFAGTWGGPGTGVAGEVRSPFSNLETPARWPMRYGQIAPRGSLAYRFSESGPVLRVGVGLYYDPAVSSIVSLANYNPLEGWQYFAPLQPGSGAVAAVDPGTLFLPRVWQWRVSLEKSLSKAAQVSASYFGSSGDRLLRPEVWLSSTSPMPASLSPTSHARSNYQSLNLQWRAAWSRFFVLSHYTWAHSIDTGSSDTEPFLVGPRYNDAVDRGSSSFDVRHVASIAAGSTLPGSSLHGLRWLSRDWQVSSAWQARTGFPFDVTSVDRSVGLGFANAGRPDLVPGQPLWLADGDSANGRRLNPAAFAEAAVEGRGTLGRNVLRGASFTQLDASLRRTFEYPTARAQS